ncbi:hypothetical protein BCR37DRAFT_387246 [Protomyces lactucae-debilis]|uniref:Hydrophobic surface binding protein A-domain-containing protein n=1 Tax=Protomyces lactucae-debilis TaxID=2754530 RepID=A0A1Y2FG01_PROLT|nr:uncharacterized protein BCR37DRAFT_387246 [Protomyces lactucae-debilis]ORY82547.1 hypothetical protein BCR37DRAFT_387246 [Protomyces lactucae-debilis]
MQLALFSIAALIASGSALTLAVEKYAASTTDIGSILKTMDQTKLNIPPAARAVMKKMPEKPSEVTVGDKAAIDACIASGDSFAQLACNAQKDQLTVLLQKVRVSNDNMSNFVDAAKKMGAKVEKE